MKKFKTFEYMKHDIPEGATHYCDETDCDFFTWLKVDGDVTCSVMPDSKNFNSWKFCSWKNIMSRAKAIPVIPQPKHTRTEYKKVTESIFDLRPDFERGELYSYYMNGKYTKVINEDDLLENYNDENLYRKVEKEIDERQEFVKEASKIWNRDDMHCSTDIFREMYDSGKFKFIG